LAIVDDARPRHITGLKSRNAAITRVHRLISSGRRSSGLLVLMRKCSSGRRSRSESLRPPVALDDRRLEGLGPKLEDFLPQLPFIVASARVAATSARCSRCYRSHLTDCRRHVQLSCISSLRHRHVDRILAGSSGRRAAARRQVSRGPGRK